VGYLDGDAYFLEKVKPIYKEFSGWQEDISKTKKHADLPQRAREYISFIEKFVNLPVKIISVGPKREQTIVLWYS